MGNENKWALHKWFKEILVKEVEIYSPTFSRLETCLSRWTHISRNSQFLQNLPYVNLACSNSPTFIEKETNIEGATTVTRTVGFTRCPSLSIKCTLCPGEWRRRQKEESKVLISLKIRKNSNDWERFFYLLLDFIWMEL